MKITPLSDYPENSVVFLVEGSEKNVLLDCGHSCCGEGTARLVKEALNGKQLDAMIPTHTHYDHIGGIPALRRVFPEAKVYGSQKAVKVFASTGAKALMKKLGDNASMQFFGKPLGPEYDDSLFTVDQLIEDGSEINVGDGTIVCLFTPGHTNCSYSFWMPEISTVLVNESVGAYMYPDFVAVDCLTGYQDSMDSIERCRKLGAEHIYTLHYGEVTKLSPAEFYNVAAKCCTDFKDMIYNSIIEGCTDEEVFERCKQRFWVETDRKSKQPLSAFTENANAFIRVVHREFNI